MFSAVTWRTIFMISSCVYETYEPLKPISGTGGMVKFMGKEAPPMGRPKPAGMPGTEPGTPPAGTPGKAPPGKPPGMVNAAPPGPAKPGTGEVMEEPAVLPAAAVLPALDARRD
jgi:hypothetical protein